MSSVNPRSRAVWASTLLVALGAAWSLWALAGAAPGSPGLLAGSIGVLVVIAAAATRAPINVSPRGPHLIAVAALLALAIWTGISLLWTPARDVALDHIYLAAIYAASFAIGVWVVALLRRRMILSLAPIIAAVGLAAIVVLASIWLADGAGRFIDQQGGLSFPVGQTGATGTLFGLGALCSIAWLSGRRTGELAAAALAAVGSLALALAVLSHDRAIVVGMVVALLALLYFSPDRRRGLYSVVVVALPVALATPVLSDTRGLDASSALPQLQEGAVAATVAALAAAALAVAWRRRGDRSFAEQTSSSQPHGRRGPAGLTPSATVLLSAAILLLAVAGTASWVSDEGASAGQDDALDKLMRGSSEGPPSSGPRDDTWRVAAGQFGDNPFVGGGAGSFAIEYAQKRDSDGGATDAHSVVLGLAGDLGIPGIGLLLLSLGAGSVAAVRAVRLGPDAAMISAAALAGAALWTVTASLDAIWIYPASTAPVFFLLGASAGPGALALEEPLGPRGRSASALVALGLALISVPLAASSYLAHSAAGGWRDDPDGSQEHLRLAAELNPLADAPLSAAAETAKRTADPVRAIEITADAIDRKPLDWRNHRRAAELLANADAAAARLELARAFELNPRMQDALELAQRVGLKSPTR